MTLHIQDLSVRFGDKTILDNISFDIADGQIIGLVAPNGTGKTTLFNAIMRYIPIQSGEIHINGKGYQNTRKDILQLHQQVTFFPDQADLYENFSGREHIKMYAETWKKNTDLIDDIIRMLRMEYYVNDKVQTYSLGMRQRLCFAMMCAADTPIMLMDEVMNGLDPENVTLISRILKQLRQEGKVIMISSHLLDNLDEYADQVFFLHAGKIVFISDHHEIQPDYVKARITPSAFDTLTKEQELPSGTLYLDNGLCCIPLGAEKGKEAEALHYVSVLRSLKPVATSIGPLGTAEHYVRLYDFNTESEEEGNDP